MIKTNKFVLLYIVILSAILLLPTITIPLVDHQARQKWENRGLTKFPDISKIITEPKPTLAQFDDFVNDHIGGGFQVIKARRNFYFNTFGATNDIYIQGNNQGAYFLTSPFQQKDRKRPFSWWDNACVRAQNPNYVKRYLERFEKSEAYLSRFGAKVIYGMVPTKSVLLQEQLPISTPQKIKEACQKISAENNWAVNYSKLNPEINFFYPYTAFKSRINDPLFYPNKGYHWEGESTWVWAEEMAKEYDLDVSPQWDYGPCKPTDVDWDIGKLIGVGEKTAGCDRDLKKLNIDVDANFMFEVGEDKKPIRITKMNNPHALNDKTAIVFSNSFGPAVREQVASHFNTTYHLRSGFVNGVNMRTLLGETDILDVDYIFVTIADFHYPSFLAWVEPAPDK